MAELACRCAGRYCDGDYWHDPAFLDGLEALRAAMNAPLRIDSGHRCAQWNAAIGGAPASMHLRIATDIALDGHDRPLILRAALQAGFTGIGLAVSFIHLDRRARPARWFFPASKASWQTGSEWRQARRAAACSVSLARPLAVWRASSNDGRNRHTNALAGSMRPRCTSFRVSIRRGPRRDRVCHEVQVMCLLPSGASLVSR